MICFEQKCLKYVPEKKPKKLFTLVLVKRYKLLVTVYITQKFCGYYIWHDFISQIFQVSTFNIHLLIKII